MNRILLIALLVCLSSRVEARLSDNPWLEPNSAEDVREIYEQDYSNNRVGYQSYDKDDDLVVIDRVSEVLNKVADNERTKETIDDMAKENDQNIFAKISSFMSKGNDSMEKNNFSKSNNALSGSSSQDPFGISGFMPKNAALPKMQIPDSNALIRKFERAIGVDFRAVAKKIR